MAGARKAGARKDVPRKDVPRLRHALLLCAVLALVPTTLPAQQPLIAPTSGGHVVEGPAAAGALPHPEPFLGYRLGSRYTHHHRIVDYFEALAAASDRMRFAEYGRTVEDRPLHLATISSASNLARMGEILDANRRLGTRPGVEPAPDQPLIVWLAYGVHGNETSSAEAAMAVAWTLVAGSDADLGFDLDDVVVVIDPLVNPDGRERYVQWFREVSGREGDAHPDALEHREPWPGGRFNHYLFDLNRDWTWLTQQESRERVAAYRKILPQVYVDVHEMSSDATYYFPPPARPVLPLLRDALADLELFGEGNAAAFDARGWTYFVREVYDFFYPGYGDTYPTLRGGLGMTYEMAGGGRAGKLLRRDDGTLLSLADRVARHAVATLETVRTGARHREHLLRRFAARRAEAATAPLQAYLWRADLPEAHAMADLLARHGLEIRRLAAEAEVNVRPVWPGERVNRSFPAGTYFVRTDQPDAALLRALMEPEHELADDFLERQTARAEAGEREELFDVTAWSLPLAYGVETWIAGTGGSSGEARLSETGLPDAEVWRGRLDAPPRDAERRIPPSKVGWTIAPQGLASHRLVASLLRHGVTLRVATAPAAGDLYGAVYRPDGQGTVFVPTEGNDADVGESLSRLVAEAASAGAGVRVEPVESGLVPGVRNPGSGAFRRVVPPRVGLVAGGGVSPTSHGGIWHLFDHQVEMPVRRLDVDHLADASLHELNVLVLPDGRWSGLSQDAREALGRWLHAGGTLVAVGGAHDLARSEEWTEIEPRAARESLDLLEAHSGRAQDPSVPGSFVAATYQIRHPLALGTDGDVAVLMRGSRFLEPTGDPRVDLLTVREESPHLAGLLWPDAESVAAGSLLVATESVGEGRLVTFAQDPAFRGFVRATMDLLLDAVFYGPSL